MRDLGENIRQLRGLRHKKDEKRGGEERTGESLRGLREESREPLGGDRPFSRFRR